MQIWLKFLQKCNGKVYSYEAEWSNLVLDLNTDRAGAQDLECGTFLSRRVVLFFLACRF